MLFYCSSRKLDFVSLSVFSAVHCIPYLGTFYIHQVRCYKTFYVHNQDKVFSTPVLIRHLWQLKTVVFLHWCLIHVVLLFERKTRFFFIFYLFCNALYLLTLAHFTLIRSDVRKLSTAIIRLILFQHQC